MARAGRVSAIAETSRSLATLTPGRSGPSTSRLLAIQGPCRPGVATFPLLASPTFFRALCHQASQGGTHGYSQAGAGIAPALATLAPWDLTADEWTTRLARLADLVTADDVPGVREWFELELPGVIAIVPARARARFATGVVAAVEDRELDLTNL